MRGGSFDHRNHGSAAVSTCGDIKEHHLIGALIIVAKRKLDRVADGAKSAFLGTPELHAAGDFPIMHIEARNDTFTEHRFLNVTRF